MKVWFAGETPQESMRFGVLLVPGENNIEPDEKAKAMIDCGLVTVGKRKYREPPE